jgi:O-antigen/teichoic acid export membrane protein
MKEQRKMSAAAAMLQGTAVLGLAAVFSKLLGTLQKIPLQNIGGDEVFGIYNAVLPFYTLIFILATAGFPVAVSKFVSDSMTRGEPEEADRILGVSVFISLILGLGMFAFMYAGAEQIARWIGQPQTAPAIRAVSFALWFAPVMAAIRGYFQGRQEMASTAVSQVTEQSVRVLTMIALLLYLTSRHDPPAMVAAGAAFGSVTGAFAALLVMIVYWRNDRRKKGRRAAEKRTGTPHRLLAGRLFRFALPVCIGAVGVPFLGIADTFTVPRMLQASGWNVTQSMEQFGIYGRGLPLVQLVAMIFSSVSAAIVPAVAEAKERGDLAAVRVRTELSLRVTWLIGLAASFGLACAALPINVMLFTDEAGTRAMQITAFSGLFSALNIITASILQGLGKALVPAASLIVAALLKVALNIWWVPAFGIDGAAASAVAAFCAAALINLAAVQKCTGIALPYTLYLFKCGAAVAVMLAVVITAVQGLPAALEWLPARPRSSRAVHSLTALAAVAAGAVSFAAAAIRMKALSKNDLKRLLEKPTNH